MERRRIVAYWDIYESGTGLLLERRLIERDPMPAVGQLVIGIPGKLQGIVRNFRFKGSRNNLPCYDVYV